MKVWIVLVVPAGGPRYTDTMWASHAAASTRKADLEEYWSAHGVPSHHKAYLLRGKVEDAAIQTEPESTSTEDDAGAQAGTRSQDS